MQPPPPPRDVSFHLSLFLRSSDLAGRGQRDTRSAERATARQTPPGLPSRPNECARARGTDFNVTEAGGMRAWRDEGGGGRTRVAAPARRETALAGGGRSQQRWKGRTEGGGNPVSMGTTSRSRSLCLERARGPARSEGWERGPRGKQQRRRQSQPNGPPVGLHRGASRRP